MRCEEGDKAVIVGGYRDNVGHLVKVTERAKTFPEAWVVEMLCTCMGRKRSTGELTVWPPGTMGVISDKHLWPLRDRPGPDEMVVIAGLPRSLWHA